MCRLHRVILCRQDQPMCRQSLPAAGRVMFAQQTLNMCLLSTIERSLLNLSDAAGSDRTTRDAFESARLEGCLLVP